MIRFHNSETNLKSSVYNLAGENYIEQLSAYNSMRCHIRRVLLAKSVVDTRNNKYINEKKKQSKSQLSKRYSLDNLIDQLAYDTKHHPLDVLRANLDEICLYHTEMENNMDLSQLQMQTDDIENDIQAICRDYAMSKARRNCRNKCAGKKPLKVYQKPLQRIQKRCEEKPIYVTCGDPIESGTSSGSSCLPCPLENYIHKHAEFEAKEDARYAAFAYDITREIIKCGLYTDKELNDIFKKHLKRHRNTLELHKMLREIYRLKTFLNITQESDESDNDIEDCISGRNWNPVVRPPTPPKVLDDNKVIGKLLSYQKLMEAQCNKELHTGKSVVFIDANPELLITERDVITSLLEVGINPKQAEHICKSLQSKSMESVLEHMAELKIKTPPSEKLEHVVEIQTETVHCTDTQAETENENLSEKENKSSITDDLTSKQDETIQTQSSPDTLRYDNYTDPMCSTFSKLQERSPLNVDEVIQTEEIEINIDSRIKMNNLGLQITEVFQAKEKFMNENTDASHIPRADILAWSRDKIAAMKAIATNIPETPVKSTEYEHRIPITKSTQKLLSSHKRKKSPKPSGKKEQVKSGKQTRKVRKDRTPQRGGVSKGIETKASQKSVKSRSGRSKKGISQKKSKRSNQPVSVPNKAKTASISETKENSNNPSTHVSKCISNAHGICITKIDTPINGKDSKRSSIQTNSVNDKKSEEDKKQPDKTETDNELNTPTVDESELNKTS